MWQRWQKYSRILDCNGGEIMDLQTVAMAIGIMKSMPDNAASSAEAAAESAAAAEAAAASFDTATVAETKEYLDIS